MPILKLQALSLPNTLLLLLHGARVHGEIVTSSRLEQCRPIGLEPCTLWLTRLPWGEWWGLQVVRLGVLDEIHLPPCFAVDRVAHFSSTRVSFFIGFPDNQLLIETTADNPFLLLPMNVDRTGPYTSDFGSSFMTSFE